MNQSFRGGATNSDDWMRAFAGVDSSGEADGSASTRSPFLTTISVSDLDQLDTFPGGAPSRFDQSSMTGSLAPDSTTAVDRHRLSGLPIKHRYKQAARTQTSSSYRRR